MSDIISVILCKASSSKDEGRRTKEAYLTLRFFLCIPASAADAAAVSPNVIKTLLANGMITFFIHGNPVFSDGPRSLPRNPPDCTIIDN